VIDRLSDAAIRHLQMITDVPDLTQTKYEISHPLGSGGMGTVYAAHDLQLDRLVALKVVGSFASSSGMIERLAQEARILARLEHPGIVPVHDVGALPDGRAFYAMKLVRGQRLDQYVTPATPLPERLRIVERLCDTVAFAHAHGVIHRDLKPSNIMVGAFGEVLVMDWGVARVLGDRADGAVIGTPGFMAPEQARGELADERADVFALGAILGFLLERNGGDQLPRHRARALNAIVACATAAERDSRYASVELLANDLTRLRAGQPISVLREGVVDRVVRLAVNYRVPLALVAAYLVMRIALAALS
jgi:serine/threonine protein kinase